MSGSHRSIGIATLVAALLIAFGLGAYTYSLSYPEQLGQYPPYQHSNSDSPQSPTRIADVPKGEVQKSPCNNPQSETESDLCAQWRSAKAAEKSADWTLYGVLASIAGINLLLWQINLTRKAVIDTGLATKAMLRQNDLTEAAQRAKVVVTLKLIHSANADEFGISVEATNIGMSIAYLDRIDVSWRRDELSFESEAFRHHALGTMLKSGESAKVWETSNRMSRLNEGRYFGGTVFYRSPFSQDHRTYFAEEYVGVLFNDTRLFVAMGHPRTKWPEDT